MELWKFLPVLSEDNIAQAFFTAEGEEWNRMEFEHMEVLVPTIQRTGNH